MTKQEVFYTLLGFFSGFLGSQLGRLIELHLNRKVQKKLQDTVIQAHWVQLPSGWMKDERGVSGYVANLDGGAVYWWVSRGGKTIVEGPSDSIDEGRVEVEAAMRDFCR